MPTPKKTDAMHWLTGTTSQAKATDAPPLPPGRPKCPRNLSRAAQAAFKSICDVLQERRALTVGDKELVRLYAIVYDRHLRALAKIEEEGEIRIYKRTNNHGKEFESEKPNYWLKIAETAEKNLVAILDRLGLTPLNRAKIKPTAQPAAAAPVDPEQAAADEFFGKLDENNWITPGKANA